MLSFYGIILMGDIMELRDVIESRRSIRKYTDELVDENIILEAIKYGIMAPSAHNRQPWKVKLIKGEDKDKIAKKEERIEAENPENIKNAFVGTPFEMLFAEEPEDDYYYDDYYDDDDDYYDYYQNNDDVTQYRLKDLVDLLTPETSQ